jgi:multiple sugar transport system permease protein
MNQAQAMTRLSVRVQQRQRARVRHLRETVKGYLFVSPWIFSLLVFTAYPVLSSFYFSVTDYNLLRPPRLIGAHNFVTMLTKDPLYWQSVYNSTYYAVLAVPLQLGVALFLAVLLNQGLRGIGVFRTIYYLPSLVPTVAGTLMGMLMLNPRSGLINQGLRALGLPAPGWLMSAYWSKPALIMMSVWASGWFMLVFLAALKEIPRVYHEAAMVDGANAWQRFRSITIPILTPAILFNLVMGIIESFQVFASAFVAAGVSGGGGGTSSGPLNSLLMYMLLLYRYGFRYFQMGYASAMALLLFVALVIVTGVLVRSSGRWVYYEGGQGR